jgi:hypothetical protein
MMLKLLTSVCGVAAALVATDASAQGVNLTGQYRCVRACVPSFGPAYITQNGWSLNLINEAGQPSQGYVDWFTQGRIWTPNWHEGAVVSPDGLVVQFDRGAVWLLRRRM